MNDRGTSSLDEGLTAMRRCSGLTWILLLAGCAAAPRLVSGGPRLAAAPSLAEPSTRASARSRVSPALREPPSRPGAFADELHLRCRSFDSSCSASVGMLARAGEPEPQRCTVSLIAPDRVITASHCLRPEERVAGAGCEGEWIAFPGRDGASMEWVACSAVERADGVDETSVMRSDVAVLRLVHPVARPVLEIDARPLEEGSIVTVVAVRPHPIYDSQHEIEGRRCRVASEDSATQTFGREASAVGWLMECPSHPGNSGSPVLDARGRLRALMHGGSAPNHGIGVTSSPGLAASAQNQASAMSR